MSRRIGLVLAVVLVTAATACTGPAQPRDDRSAAVPTTVAPRTTSIDPQSVWGTKDLARGSSIAVAPAGGRVTVGNSGHIRNDHPGVAVVNFGLLPGATSCISRVVLQFSVAAAPATAPLAVYPVDPRFRSLAAGDPIDGWSLLIDNRPRGEVALRGTEGEADVTTMAVAYLGGGPLHNGRYLSVRSPLVVSIQPERLAEGTFELVTADPPPRLTVTHNC